MGSEGSNSGPQAYKACTSLLCYQAALGSSLLRLCGVDTKFKTDTECWSDPREGGQLLLYFWQLVRDEHSSKVVCYEHHSNQTDSMLGMHRTQWLLRLKAKDVTHRETLNRPRYGMFPWVQLTQRKERISLCTLPVHLTCHCYFSWEWVKDRNRGSLRRDREVMIRKK